MVFEEVRDDGPFGGPLLSGKAPPVADVAVQDLDDEVEDDAVGLAVVAGPGDYQGCCRDGQIRAAIIEISRLKKKNRSISNKMLN